MTEEKWLLSGNSTELLRYLNRPRGDRKLLLYAVACCRTHEHLLTHKVSHKAIEWAEQFADGLVIRDDEYSRLDWRSEGAAFHAESTSTSQNNSFEDWDEDPKSGGRVNLTQLSGPIPDRRLRIDAAYFANSLMTWDSTEPYDPAFTRYKRFLSVPLLRDIFGNPFRPVAFNSIWRTPRAISYATSMYDSRDFSAMPILADALQDAGCDNDDILNHCRDANATHVRGCWVVDLVLGHS